MKITPAYTECKQRDYSMTKGRKTYPGRMEAEKYYRPCKEHTIHKETK